MAVEINPTTLEVIQMDNRRTDDCFNDVLTKWLRNNKPLSCWKNITTALQSIGIKVLLGMSLIFLLTLAAKCRRRVTAIIWRFLSVRPSVRLSVRRNLPELTGKGR
jgi:hypothetical protein